MFDGKGSDQLQNDKQKLMTRTLIITTLLIGAITLIIVLGSVFLGMWLDRTFMTHPAFTIGLVLASIPVSIIGTIFIVKAIINRFRQKTNSIDNDYQ